MSYLDKNGLTHFFEKLKGVFAPKECGVEYIRGTWTAASGAWTGVTKDSELYDGKQIILYMPFAGSGNATLNLTLAGGGTTGAKNVYFESTTRFTTHKGQNSQLPLVYHKALKLSDNKTYEGWWYLANRDTNDNRTHTLRLYNTIKAKKAIAKNTFIVGDADGYETLAVGVTFDIAYPVLFCGAALAVNGTNYADMYEQWYDLTLTNTLSSFVGVAGKMIYVVGTLSGTKFTVASPGATCEEPTSEDGKVYLLLGRCGNNYSDSTKNRVNLVPEHPLYAFQNGSFRPYVPPVNAEKVNGHTINADVPSGAKFTDTNTWRGIQDNLTSDSATDSLSAKQGKALANGSARDSTKLPLAGGTMTGQLQTSFKGSVAFGSYGASATTIENLCEELRYSSGAIGSVNITTAYTKDIVTIPTGWYNFLWIPHRSGGQNGQAHNDNCNYGSLYLTNMTANESQFFFIHWTASSGVVALEDLLHTVLDYNNNTRIRFGYSTSGMTSASWLAAWDGYKLRAIAPGNLSINPSQIADGFTTNPFYINTHPESSPTIIPFINNDIAFLLKRGGSAVVKYDGVVKNVDISNVFDGSPSYWAINPTGVTEITIELTLHKAFTWTNNIYVDHGANSWRSKYVKIEVTNTDYANDVWVQKLEETARTLGRSKVIMSHTPVGASNAGYGFNKIRFTFKDWATSTIFRIAQIGVINYGSSGLRETSMSRGIDDPIFRSITPNEDNTYMLGWSSKRWSNVYAQKGDFAGGITGNLTGNVTGKVNGHTVNADVPSGAKFTDTTYTAATAAPGKVTSASAQGTSTNYARQDHTHGIDVGTGDANGQVKIAGQNASVKGLAALAYKDSLTASDIPELNASKITAGTFPAARLPVATEDANGIVNNTYIRKMNELWSVHEAATVNNSVVSGAFATYINVSTTWRQDSYTNYWYTKINLPTIKRGAEVIVKYEDCQFLYLLDPPSEGWLEAMDGELWIYTKTQPTFYGAVDHVRISGYFINHTAVDSGMYTPPFKMELVWENASPGTTFLSQTLDLDMHAYDMALVETQALPSSNEMGITYETGIIAKGVASAIMGVGKTSNRTGLRKFTMTDAGIDVGEGIYNNGTHNDYFVPSRIYGIRGFGVFDVEPVWETLLEEGEENNALFPNKFSASSQLNGYSVGAYGWGTYDGNTGWMIHTRPQSDSWAYLYSNDKIDITDYSYIVIDCYFYCYGGAAYVGLTQQDEVSGQGFVPSGNPTNIMTVYAHPVDTRTKYRGEVRLNVKELTGEYRLVIACAGSGNSNYEGHSMIISAKAR